LLNRDKEARALLEAAVSGNNSRLVAPRRYGKTSLLARIAQEARAQKGWAAVYVDFFGVLTLDDIAQRIERAYAEELQGRLATWFAGVRRLLRPTLQVGGGSLPAGDYAGPIHRQRHAGHRPAAGCLGQRRSSRGVGTSQSPLSMTGARVAFEVKGKRVYVNDARVITPDIRARNGIVHAIDRVLIPPSLR
jgi:hypothetical protein